MEKKYSYNGVRRNFIIALLQEEPDDEKLAQRVGIEDASIITQIRQKERERQGQIREVQEQIIREEVALGKTGEQIREKLGCSLSMVYYKRNRISNLYTNAQIIALLQEEPDDEKVAQRVGIEDASIIMQIRQKEKERQEKEEKVLKRIQQVIREGVALGRTGKEIGEELGYSESTISHKRRQIPNLYTNAQIVALLQEEPDDEKVAQKVGIENAGVIKQIRQIARQKKRRLGGQQDNSTKKIEGKQTQVTEQVDSLGGKPTETSDLKPEEVEIQPTQEKTKNRDGKLVAKIKIISMLARKYKTIEQWENKTGCAQYQIVMSLRNLNDAGMATQELEDILADWETRHILDIPFETRQIKFKIEKIGFIGVVKRTSREENKKGCFNFYIEKMLALYEEFIEEEMYAYICLAYVKSGEYLKGMELAEKKLGLETLSISSLKTKIEEVIAKAEEKRKQQKGIRTENTEKIEER